MSVRGEKITRHKLSDEVLDRLLALIEREEIAPGDPLPSERTLMERFGVGRPSVREALQALENLGFLEIRQGERSRLRRPTPGLLFEQIDVPVRHLLKASAETRAQMREARILLETGSARLAAGRAAAKDVRSLSLALEEQRDAAGNPARFVAADIAFHQAIAAMTRNPILAAATQAILSWAFEFFPRLLRAPSTEPLTLEEHQAILDAIRRRDPEAAAQAMHRHLTRANPLYPKS